LLLLIQKEERERPFGQGPLKTEVCRYVIRERKKGRGRGPEKNCCEGFERPPRAGKKKRKEDGEAGPGRKNNIANLTNRMAGKKSFR